LSTDSLAGSGRRTTTLDGRTVVWSNGRADGYRSYVGFNRDERIGVVALVNAGTGPGVDDVYRTSRGEFTPASSSPELTTHPTLTSNVKFMNFYPFNDIETISPRPMLFITGDQAHSKEFSEEAYRLADQPKELYWVKGAGHVDLYDRVDLIPFDKLSVFFKQNLAAK